MLVKAPQDETTGRNALATSEMRFCLDDWHLSKLDVPVWLANSLESVLRSSAVKSLSIIFLDHEIVESVFQRLRKCGCVCEYGEFGSRSTLRMLAVSVPASCDYAAIVEYLGALEERDLVSYSELAI